MTAFKKWIKSASYEELLWALGTLTPSKDRLILRELASYDV